jgi:hypothetical protein
VFEGLISLYQGLDDCNGEHLPHAGVRCVSPAGAKLCRIIVDEVSKTEASAIEHLAAFGSLVLIVSDFSSYLIRISTWTHMQRLMSSYLH